MRALLLALVAVSASAAPFQFTVVVRAGSAGSWQLGIGTDAAHITSTASITFPNGATPEDFEIGFNHLTNTATAIYYYNNGNSIAVVSMTGAGVFDANTTWTLPAASFAVKAESVPVNTEVRADKLSLSSGLNVISPIAISKPPGTEATPP